MALSKFLITKSYERRMITLSIINIKVRTIVIFYSSSLTFSKFRVMLTLDGDENT